MKSILFSPVGMSDPIHMGNLSEGSMLHIARNYHPDLIFLYMSKEVCEYDAQDNRYIKALQILYEHWSEDIGPVQEIEESVEEVKQKYQPDLVGKIISTKKVKNIEELVDPIRKNSEPESKGTTIPVIKIKRPDLVKAHEYDFFYNDFSQILQNIRRNNPDAQLIVNMSSGTPAMKSALHVLTAFSEARNIKLVQVSTPAQKANKGNDHEQYDEEVVSLRIRENNERGDEIEDRSKEIQFYYLNYQINKRLLINHLNSYNYPAARQIGDEIAGFLSQESKTWLQLAESRIAIDRSNVERLRKNLSVDDFWYKGFEERIIEYYLYLEICVRRKNYLEFVRGLSPLIYEVFDIYLREICKINVKQFAERLKSGAWRFSQEKLIQGGEKGRRIRYVLEQNSRSDPYGIPIYSSQLQKLIQEFQTNANQAQLAADIRHVESEARNIAAHQITSMTDEELKAKTGFTASEILNKIKRLLKAEGFKLNERQWDSYKQMNLRIIESLQ